MQALAVVAKVLLLLLLLGNSHSFAQEEEATTCGDEMTTDSRICNELFQVFQASIVTGNTANLYNLRKIFFPSKRSPPTLLNVSYELNFETEVEIPCDFDSNDTVNSSEVLYRNLGWTSQSIYTIFHPATLNRFQPQFFYEMMVQLESSNSESALPWEGTDQLLTLHLFLHLKKLSCLPSYTQIYETLQDMTSVLKVYARDQKNLTEWQNRDSYVLDGRVFNEKWWKYECDIYYVISCNIRIINLVFSLFLTLAGGVAIVVIMYLVKGPKRMEDENKVKDLCCKCIETCSKCIETCREAGDSETPETPGQGLNQLQQTPTPVEPVTKEEKENVAYPFYHSLLWSATGVLFWGWLVVYVTEMIKTNEWREHTPDTREVDITIAWLVIMLIVATSASLFFSLRIMITIDLLHPSNAIWGGIGGCRWDILICGFCACLGKWLSCEGGIFERIKDKLRDSPTAKHVVGAIPLLVIFLWIGYIALNAVPIILYFLLYPTRVLCLYTYVLAALAFLIFIITEGDYERRITKKKLKEQNQNVDTITWIKHHYLIYTSIFGPFFLGIATVVFVVTYRTIVAGGMTGNALYGIFRALIPALLLGAPSGWIGKRLKEHYQLEKKKAKEKEPTQIHCTCTCRCHNKEGAAEEGNAGITDTTQC